MGRGGKGKERGKGEEGRREHVEGEGEGAWVRDLIRRSISAPGAFSKSLLRALCASLHSKSIF